MTERSTAPKPDYVVTLEAQFGAPSQAAFGSAVFTVRAEPGASLEQAALATYRHFVGELWVRDGEAAWMSAWQLVYTRPAHASANLVAELDVTELVVYAIGDGAAMSGVLLVGLRPADHTLTLLILLMD
jgi:hypothetical protein